MSVADAAREGWLRHGSLSVGPVGVAVLVFLVVAIVAIVAWGALWLRWWRIRAKVRALRAFLLKKEL